MEPILVDDTPFEIRGKIMMVFPNEMNDTFAKKEEDNTSS